jgi:ATP-binding cassette subfamily F protein 3
MLLAEALSEYQGTLIVVSHDRSFISRVSNKILEIRNGSVELFPGSYDDYLWSLEKGALKERYAEADSMENKIKSTRHNASTSEKKFNYKEETKRINSEIKELERKILKTEEILFSLNTQIEDFNTQLLTTQGQQAQKIAIESAEASKNITETEDVLMTHMENLDLKQKELQKLTTT